MKTILKILVVLSLFSVSLFAGKGKDTLKQKLTVKCSAVLTEEIEGEPEEFEIAGATVTVLDKSYEVIHVAIADKKGKCEVIIPMKGVYYVHITKVGFYSKMIQVNCDVPKDMIKNKTFEFDVELLQEIHGFDASVLSKPIGKVKYDKTTNEFVFDAEYANKMAVSLRDLRIRYSKAIHIKH